LFGERGIAGAWVETPDKNGWKLSTAEGGHVTWYPSTGTVFLQGNVEDIRPQIEEALSPRTLDDFF
jgi:hypothetical protein